MILLCAATVGFQGQNQDPESRRPRPPKGATSRPLPPVQEPMRTRVERRDLLQKFKGPSPLAGFYRSASFVPFTAVCNMAGIPAMSMPLHWNGEGLPIGSHFAGRFGDEATLFRLAAQLESARPWADKRPKVCA